MARQTWSDLDHYDVELMDGTVVESRAPLRARLEVERKWPAGTYVGDDGSVRLRDPRPPEEALFFLAWWGLGKPGESFEAWLDGVRDVREVYRSEDPSVPAAGDDSSAR